MKAISFAVIILLGASGYLQAQETDWVITEAGPHHRVWAKPNPVPRQKGQPTLPPKTFVEISSGLNYKNEAGAWTSSSERIEIIGNHAVARHGQMKVIFPANINSQPGVDIDGNGKRLKTQILGLAYADDAGHAVLFAPLQDSTGFVRGENAVEYPRAFEGIDASVEYVYRRGGLSQNILLFEAPPDPASLGADLDPKTCRLEVWTEILDAPSPKKREHPTLRDEHLDFGGFEIGSGRAFVIPGEKLPHPVGKTWTTIGQRTFLIEAVQHEAALPGLSTLPRRQAALPKDPQKFLMADVRAGKQALPKRAEVRIKDKPILTAQIAARKPGYVLDFEAVLSVSNMLFQSDRTYYVSGPVTLSGTTTFEGGTVLKYSRTNSSKLTIAGPISCLADFYRPAFLTGDGDSSVGEQIRTNLVTRCGDVALFLDYYTAQTLSDIKHMRISYFTNALYLWGGSGHTFTHMQITHCDNLMTSYFADSNFRNVLFYDVGSLFYGSGVFSASSRAENCTFHLASFLNYGTNMSLFFTNCLFGGINNLAPLSGRNNATNNTYGDAFRMVGAGNNYLTNSSPYRNAGTTNITASLLADLRKLTTYPPLIVSNTLYADTTWGPVVQRDTDDIDIGYHYYPIDYAVNRVYLTNANTTLTLTNGVVVASFGDVAFWLWAQTRFVSEGAPGNLNRIVRYNMVQEQEWTGSQGTFYDVVPSATDSTLPSFSARFTSFDYPADDGVHIYSIGSSLSYAHFRLQDCELLNGGAWLYGSAGTAFGLTNNLFLRCWMDAGYDARFEVYNNLFYGSTATLILNDNGIPIVFKNNAFHSSFVDDWSEVISNEYNAYITTNIATSGRILPGSTNDLIVSNLTYYAGPLGRFYQATNSALIDRGSTNAQYSGLYHYTTTTNLIKETNSVINIGYHYVATDSSGAALDSDGDGWPDYYEDSSGDGTLDSGETDPTNPNDLGIKVLITQPRDGSSTL